MVALGGRASLVKVKIGNIWLLELDADNKPLTLKYYEKQNSSLSLPPGAGMYGTGLMGIFARTMGGFDYQFTQQSTDASTFNATYVNYDREEGEKSKPIVASIFLAKDGSLNYDKVDISSPKKTTQALYPAAGNSVMLAQHNYKQDKLELKLIKMNY